MAAGRGEPVRVAKGPDGNVRASRLRAAMHDELGKEPVHENLRIFAHGPIPPRIGFLLFKG